MIISSPMTSRTTTCGLSDSSSSRNLILFFIFQSGDGHLLQAVGEQVFEGDADGKPLFVYGDDRDVHFDAEGIPVSLDFARRMHVGRQLPHWGIHTHLFQVILKTLTAD